MDIKEVLKKLRDEFNGAHGRTPWRRYLLFVESIHDALADKWEMQCSVHNQGWSSGSSLVLDHCDENFTLRWRTGSDHKVLFQFGFEYEEEPIYRLNLIVIGEEKSETFYPTIREMFQGERIQTDKEVI